MTTRFMAASVAAYVAQSRFSRITLLAAAAIALLSFSTTADAHRSHATAPDAATMTNDGRYVGQADPAASQRAARARHATRGASGAREGRGSPPKAPIEVAKAPSPAPGVVRANRHGMVWVKTAGGCDLEINPIDATKFLTAFRLMHERGWPVPCHLVGGYSPGHKPGSNHRIGRAADIQSGWNRGPWFVYTKEFDRILRIAGLHNGCSFGDCGHMEAVRGLHNARPNLAAAIAKFNGELAAKQDEALAWSTPTVPEQTVEVSAERTTPSRHGKRRYVHHHRRRHLAQAG